MADLNEQITNSIENLQQKFEGGSAHQGKILNQAMIIRRIALVVAAVFITVILQTMIVKFMGKSQPIAPWDADLSSLLSPLAIIVSVLTASYLALVQLSEKVRRDRVEHAHDLCSSAPDINIVFASIGPLNNHFEEAYKHCLEDSQQKARTPSNDGSWEVFVTKLEHMADQFPSAIKHIPKNLRADHNRDLDKINEALAFFEKTASAICEKHADDCVVWSRYNVAGISIWINSFPVIIDRWARHTSSKYLTNIDTIGLPFEHFEAWLRYHGSHDGNQDLNQLLNRLANIRAKVLKAT